MGGKVVKTSEFGVKDRFMLQVSVHHSKNTPAKPCHLD
jgi:hypothetical protein